MIKLSEAHAAGCGLRFLDVRPFHPPQKFERGYDNQCKKVDVWDSTLWHELDEGSHEAAVV